MQNYKTIDIVKLKELVAQENCTIIDVREENEFKAKRIPNAINIPLSQCTSSRISELDNANIIIHCQSGRRSENACKKLSDIKHKNIFNLEGGILSFEKNKGNVIKNESSITIIQQVHIIVGGMVFLGTILSLLHSFYWVYMSSFFGLGLFFAGITGWCGMAKLLMLMPWNKS